MVTISRLILALFVVYLFGCTSDSEPEPEKDAKPEADVESKKDPKSADKQSEILEPAMKTLNNAKSMEQQLKDAEAERKKKMDEQEEDPN